MQSIAIKYIPKFILLGFSVVSFLGLGGGAAYAVPESPTSLFATDQPSTTGGAILLQWAPSASAGVTQQRVFRATSEGGPYTLLATVNGNDASSYTDTTVLDGTAYYYVIRSYWGSMEHFSDDPLVSKITTVKANHIAELREAIDSLRSLAQLPGMSWSDSPIPGTVIRGQHVIEMRQALSEALVALGQSAPIYTDQLVNPTVIKKEHFDELRQWTRLEESPASNEAGVVAGGSTVTVSGRVIDSDGGATLSGAEIRFMLGGEIKGLAISGSDGLYSIDNLYSGTYQVTCSAPGYITVRFLISLLNQAESVDCSVRSLSVVSSYVYDERSTPYGQGRLTSVISEGGAMRYEYRYDQRGRVTEEIRTIDGVSYRFHQTYDSVSRLETITYPDDSVVQYRYTPNGFLESVFDPNAPVGTLPYAGYSEYNALAQAGRVTYGNGVTTAYQYKPDNFRLHSIFTTNPASGQCFQSLTYDYDAYGNVEEIKDFRSPATENCGTVPDMNSQSFEYDHLSRLQTATGPYGSDGIPATLTYAYDEIGNMVCNTEISPCNEGSPNYTYPPSGSGNVGPHRVQTVLRQDGLASFGYDGNGNILHGDGRTIVYNQDNRPVEVSTSNGATTFVYDGNGSRVKKIVGQATTIYVGSLYECVQDSAGTKCTKHIYSGSERIAMKDDVSTLYFHSDHIGSTRIVTSSGTDSAGNTPVVQSLQYFPYGGTRTDSSGGLQSVKYKYTGQELDFETGLYNYGGRMYDPKLGRFISPDPFIFRPSNPQRLNRYAYVGNNPVNNIDPTGYADHYFTNTTTFSNHTGGLPVSKLTSPLGNTYEFQVAASIQGWGRWDIPTVETRLSYVAYWSDVALHAWIVAHWDDLVRSAPSFGSPVPIGNLFAPTPQEAESAWDITEGMFGVVTGSPFASSFGYGATNTPFELSGPWSGDITTSDILEAINLLDLVVSGVTLKDSYKVPRELKRLYNEGRIFVTTTADPTLLGDYHFNNGSDYINLYKNNILREPYGVFTLHFVLVHEGAHAVTSWMGRFQSERYAYDFEIEVMKIILPNSIVRRLSDGEIQTRCKCE